MSKGDHGLSSRPLVTTVIPTFNRAQLLKRAVQSALSQTYQDFEVIVVDDASNDKTPEVIGGIADGRTRYIRHEKNKGVSAARNTGILAAKGTLIGFLDSDDEWLPHKLQKQVDTFNRASDDTGLVYGACLIVDEEKAKPIRLVTPRKRGYVFRDMLMSDFVMSPTPLVKRDCFDNVGLFADDLQTSEDWDMWLRISRCYRFDFVKETVARYYLSPQQTTQQVDRVAEGYLKFMAKHLDLVYRDPAILANHFKVLGQLYVAHAQHDTANHYFIEAVRVKRNSPSLYLHLLAARITPRIYLAAGRWLNRRS
jgi:glycosyltransferase involved in cell wall biosynthesis